MTAPASPEELALRLVALEHRVVALEQAAEFVGGVLEALPIDEPVKTGGNFLAGPTLVTTPAEVCVEMCLRVAAWLAGEA